MDGKLILKKIVDHSGSCDWIITMRDLPCYSCPMSMLKKHPDGNYMSCVEALGTESMDDKDANRVYKDKAGHLLLDLQVDEMLSGNKD